MRGTAIHYESTGEYDLIDVIQDYQLNFNRGNALKYIIRAGKKDDELQDLIKAKDYIERELQYVRELRHKKAEEVKGNWVVNSTKMTVEEIKDIKVIL